MNDHKSLLSDLKSRENWVCWRYKQRDGKKTKIPVDPHTGQFASSSDSDTWSDFETAQEHYENGDTDGLGFVFGDDDLISGVDLDNVRDPETGELEEWAEDIINQIDSYTEVSPSGTGVHILQFGILPQNARTRADQKSTLERFDSSECEMYDSGRFFTMSFDHLEDTPTELKQRNDELREVHTEYLAEEDDDEEQTTTTEPTESELDLSDQELIEKAKQAENGQDFERLWNGRISAYDDDHSRADQALCNHLAFWTQKDPTRIEQLFEKSGLVRGKWLNREDYRQRTIENAIRNTSETYQPPQNDDSDDINRTIPTDAETDLVEQAGRYFELRETNGGDGTTDSDSEWIPVTNFTLESQAYVVDEHGQEYVDLRIHPSSDAEDSYDVVVPWTSFNEIRKFKNQVVTGRTTTFEGSPRHLNDLRLIVSHQGAPKLQKTKKLGLHDTEIVTVDGVLGTDEPSYRYVQQQTDFETKFELDEIGNFDKDEVSRILELIPETRNKERLLPVLGFWYGSLFTPYIREWEGEVPFLGVFAETGAGKSTLFELLCRLIGLDDDPLSVKDTEFAKKNHFSAAKNIPVWVDEYKPSELPDWQVNNLHDFIRKATRGAVESAGSREHTGTKSWQFGGPVVVSGEQTIKGSAENRRMIQVQLLKESVKEDTHWTELTGGTIKEDGEIVNYDGYNTDDHAQAIWQYLIDSDSEELHKNWQTAKQQAYEIADESGVEDIEALEITQIAMVKFGLAVYRHFASTVGASPEISEEEVEEALLYVAGSSGQSNRENHLDEFLSMLSQAARAQESEVWTDYAVVNAGKSDEKLCVKLDQAHASVRKYIRDYDLSSDVFDSPKDYRDRLNEAEEDSDSYVLDTSKVHADLNRCVAIDMEQADEEVDGFDHKAFER